MTASVCAKSVKGDSVGLCFLELSACPLRQLSAWAHLLPLVRMGCMALTCHEKRNGQWLWLSSCLAGEEDAQLCFEMDLL